MEKSMAEKYPADFEYFKKHFHNINLVPEITQFFIPFLKRSDALHWFRSNHEVYELCKERVHGNTFISDHLLFEEEEIAHPTLHGCILAKQRRDQQYAEKGKQRILEIFLKRK
jgi:hypothetical protein